MFNEDNQDPPTVAHDIIHCLDKTISVTEIKLYNKGWNIVVIINCLIWSMLCRSRYSQVQCLEELKTT